ncbi:MAG: membrane lipoprotein lipid attachment site-containing protein [Deltaproteobacteria bacterium]|nr:membrane lipoprotein lipid attachment site-containing protein [Deltaproteobacteria bacterium]
MKKIFLGLVAILLLAGCHGGNVTDVGNPTSTNLPESATQQALARPSFQQLLGNFEVNSPPDSNVVAGSPSSSSTSPCQSDVSAIQKISAGSVSNQIILENFFSYSASTKKIVADYDSKMGQVSFKISDKTVAMSCAGSAFMEGDIPVIDFSCSVTKPVVKNCSLSVVQD